MLQNSETHLKNDAALYKIFKECLTTIGKLCDKEFSDAKVQGVYYMFSGPRILAVFSLEFRNLLRMSDFYMIFVLGF